MGNRNPWTEANNKKHKQISKQINKYTLEQKQTIKKHKQISKQINKYTPENKVTLRKQTNMILTQNNKRQTKMQNKN